MFITQINQNRTTTKGAVRFCKIVRQNHTTLRDGIIIAIQALVVIFSFRLTITAFLTPTFFQIITTGPHHILCLRGFVLNT